MYFISQYGSEHKTTLYEINMAVNMLLLNSRTEKITELIIDSEETQ